MLVLLAGCSAEAGPDPVPAPEGSTTTDPAPNADQAHAAFGLEIPAGSKDLPGATAWRFQMEGDGGRAWAVDAQGTVLVEFSLSHVKGVTRIENLKTAERLVIGADGTITESTLQEANAAHASALSADVKAHRSAHPDVAMNCYWEFAQGFAWCTGAIAVCIHPFTSWLGCAGMAASCGSEAGDWYFGCYS